jgi:hypothetical protein
MMLTRARQFCAGRLPRPPKHPAAARRAAEVQSLESRLHLAVDFRISEFMAANVSTLADEDGHFSDWVEIRNAGNTPGDLAGYRLTDNAGNRTLWTFPSVTVPAFGHVVVFASGKDRTDPAAPLHTNFSLNGDGEYLALVAPDGTTRNEFAPQFPDQEEDVSYGVDFARSRLAYFAEPTPGALNARAEVVINEIHYDPDVKTQLVEFLELHNPGVAPVDLSNAYFSDGITYTFAPGTTLAPGAYVALAQDAAQFQAKFGVAPHGQYVGALSNDGETVTLRNATGGRLDFVDYRPGFPWPTVGDAPGYSIELINPDFDNSVGGNWRAFGGVLAANTLVPANSNWKYFRGYSEASAPVAAWRQPGFDDSSWEQGPGPVGYDSGLPMGSQLGDMFGGYASVFMRKTFNVANPASVGTFRLEAMIDDGFNVWINGQHAFRHNLPSNEMGYGGVASSATESAEYRPFVLPNSVFRQGTNTIAVQFHNSSIANSSDAYFDARLVGVPGAGASPTPGARNSVNAANAPPQMRQVNHTPEQPAGGEVVTVTARITDPDGVASAALHYQVVEPGAYININDPEYQTNWATLPMLDTGAGGDLVAGDGVYSVQLPADVQVHRRLVRYRVSTADTRGASVTAPYADDSVPNFAYFVYDGVPSWTGAAGDGSPEVTYSPELMRSLPAYHLISKNADVESATWWSKYGGDNYLWKGTLVYDGVVYDHVSYRARGGVWRYAMVKNMWKFDFNHNHGFQARDDYGNKYATTWDKLNLSAIIQQGDYAHRGEQGLFESVGMKLFNLAGVPAPVTNFTQLRVIDEAAESGTTQYDGDLWGMYLAIEQPDGNFLDQHGLPDGNLYKMEGGTGELNNQGPTQPNNKSDLNAFQAGYRNPSQTDQWFRDNMNLESYYGYRAIVEAIHHYDIDESAGKNYFFYHNPVTDKWETTVWDLDLTWADNMYGGGDEPFRDVVLPRPALGVEYKNRLRELRDLLWNADQAGALIDEMAAKVYTPGAPSWVDVDRAMWDYNPIMNDSSRSTAVGKAGTGRYYRGGGGQVVPLPTFAGMMQKMKSYVLTRGTYLDNLSRDTEPGTGLRNEPARPTVTFLGAAGFHADDLRFRSSQYVDPNNTPFAAMEWRIAEVTNPAAPGYDPKAPKKYEIDAAWESGELTTFAPDVTIPATVVVAGRTYRVRVRMKDATGRWSNWSAAQQFVAGAPDATVKDALRITEVHYHPAANPAGPPAEDAFEFVELRNVGSRPINLLGVEFTNGIDYVFGDVDLGAGEYIVVARDRDAFAQRYGAAGINLAPGAFANRLDNGSDRIVLLDATRQVIHDFTYFDTWHPTTDGDGPSLVVIDPSAPLTAWGEAQGWRPSASVHGSPGRADVADTTAPTADITDVTPDPRGTPVDSINIVFSEPVTGLDLADLSLVARKNGGNPVNLLTAAQTLTTADNITWTLGNLSGLTGPLGGGYLLSLRPGAASGIRDAAGNLLAAGAVDEWRTTAVAGRHVFYNNSAFDGRNRLANAADDAAIATDKSALLPGRPAAFANYTASSNGVNGIMIDVAGMPEGTARGPIPGDFIFKAGNGGNPSDWATVSAPASVAVRRGAGVGGSDRITITWADGAIRNKWLQVTVKAGNVIGLPADDVFYFGNLVGETGNASSPVRVNAVDVTATRAAQRTASGVAGRFDFNRDGRVNAADLAVVRGAMNKTLAPLTAPAAGFGQVLIAASDSPLRATTSPARRKVYGPPSDVLG